MLGPSRAGTPTVSPHHRELGANFWLGQIIGPQCVMCQPVAAQQVTATSRERADAGFCVGAATG